MIIKQRTRLIILIIYIAALIYASKISLGFWIPPASYKGLWFYTGLAALLLGNFIVSPFFTKPADSISYSVAAIIGLLAVSPWSQYEYSGFDKYLWFIASIYLVLIILSAMTSIVLRDSTGIIRSRLSKSLYLFTDTFGTPKFVFSVVFVFALIVFHRYDPREYIVISISWFFAVGLQPLEIVFNLIRKLWDLWKSSVPNVYLGNVVGHDVPSVVLIRQEKNIECSFGDTLIARSENGALGLAMALDYIGFADGCWLRALHLSIPKSLRDNLGKSATAQIQNESYASLTDIKGTVSKLINDRAWVAKDRLIGLVGTETDVSCLRFEIVRYDLNLEEGHLVEVQIADKAVLYQIINGLTKEEIIQQKNTHGYVKAEAKKIGFWNTDKRRFEVVKWIPKPNAPVFIIHREKPTIEKEVIGYFPATSYPVSIDVNPIVTHNAAVLGILGAGKSYLALEIVERMIDSGIKVICFDLTNQYIEQLAPYYKKRQEELRLKVLSNAGPRGKNNFQQNVEDGGSIGEFKKLTFKLLKRFLNSKNASNLMIVNPAHFEVWRQDSKLFSGRASMASLTPTEITRIFTESALEVVQEMGMSDEARCCLVFEEAHSLIPEWTAVASEGDKAATNGTAKAILQGRKYGLGCMVITQRTANVTKSILNQCNTVFALRVFDATGMEFLKNYIGVDYAGVLSTLEDRHAVVFGRASSCRNPVLIRLNDRENFVNVFRNSTERTRDKKS